MSLQSRVVWSQGMFLLPHHFQQEARHVEYQIDMRLRAAGPHAWGFFELGLDEGQLALGRVSLLRASGVLPDGTPFSIPGNDAVPVPLDVPADMKGELVYLAIPLKREGVTEVAFDGEAQEMYRYRAADNEIRDHTSAGDDPEAVQTGALQLRLLRGRDASDAYALLGVARVMERRPDHQVVLDRAYIAPQTRIEATT